MGLMGLVPFVSPSFAFSALVLFVSFFFFLLLSLSLHQGDKLRCVRGISLQTRLPRPHPKLPKKPLTLADHAAVEALI